MSPVLSIITSLVLLATLVLKKKKKNHLYSINTLCHLFSHHDTNILDEGKKKNQTNKNKCKQYVRTLS